MGDEMNKARRTLSLLLLNLLLCVSTGAAATPSWVSNLPLWQWYSIPNTALSSIEPSPRPAGNTGPSSKIIAWTGATLKRKGSIYLIGAAGGHADYAGNEVDALELNTESPRWKQLSPPSPHNQLITGAQYYLDTKPAATHTYYATQFIDARNRMLVIASPGMDMGGLPLPPAGWAYLGNPGYSFSFHLETNTWDPPEYIERYGGGGDFTAALVAKHPVTEDIYYSRTGDGWWRWTQLTNTWTKLSNNGETNYAGAAIDPTRSRMLIVGSYGGDVNPRVRDLTGNLIPVTFGGLGAAALKLGGYPGVIYDEANDKFLVFHNSASGIAVHRVDAATWFVDAAPLTGPAPSRRTNGVHNSVQYVPELGGVVLANDYHGNVLFVRTSATNPSSSAPPAPPGITISATPSPVSSGSTSTLTWNAINSTSCAASGAWSGNKPVSGSEKTGALTTDTIFTLTCTGIGGTETQSVAVAIAPLSSSPPSSANSTLLVKFGGNTASNSFGLTGWSTVLKDVYTDYRNIGTTGTTIVVGDNYSYNFQGVSGTAKTFLPGDRIRVTWYNNSGSPKIFKPNVSFTDPDRIGSGANGIWYSMTTVNAPPFGSATSEYTFDSSSAGVYSLVNVNVNYANNQIVMADKIELLSPESSNAPGFDFSLVSSGALSVIQGQSISSNITAILLSGAIESAAFSVSGWPPGVMGTFSEPACKPTCSTTLQISTLPTATVGDNTVTVTAVAGSLTRAISFVLNVRSNATTSQTGLPVGQLIHDGPATPEQISLLLPVLEDLPQTATGTVRYKALGSSHWLSGHPLFRIRPTLSSTPAVGSIPDAFAWPIIDLSPGISYEVEVTVTSGTVSAVRTGVFTTRPLPASSMPPNKVLTPESSNSTIQGLFNSLVAGDVLEFKNGIYQVDNLQLIRSGTSNRPIYIRGESRTGVILSDLTGRILHILDASHIVLENMTLRGSGVDSGTSASSVGIQFHAGSTRQTRITIRNLTITGVDVGIKAYHEISEFLAYDNTLIGNNRWSAPLIDSNATWDDDGINIPGYGNCAFNNTLQGFGDAFAVDTGGLATDSTGIHVYRNDIRNSGDDGFEADGAHRNISFYDNRIHNAMTFLSLDPLFGGPLLFARNIIINVGRTPFKWNNQNSGQFIYNNTIVETSLKNDVSGWYQPNNGAQRAYGYRNNILIYRGNGLYTPWLESSGHDPIDWTHNSWFPNKGIQWGRAWISLNTAQTEIPATTQIFSGNAKRLTNDGIVTSNPFSTAIVLGSDYHTEVTVAYIPHLASDSAARNSGATIQNITDGFSGPAPDRGAIISGKPVVQYGDRSLPMAAPAAPTALVVQ
jgi:hypothetical protein